MSTTQDQYQAWREAKVSHQMLHTHPSKQYLSVFSEHMKRRNMNAAQDQYQAWREAKVSHQMLHQLVLYSVTLDEVKYLDFILVQSKYV